MLEKEEEKKLYSEASTQARMKNNKEIFAENIIETVKKTNINGFNKPISHYLKLEPPYTPNSSDSEGTVIYKSMLLK